MSKDTRIAAAVNGLQFSRMLLSFPRAHHLELSKRSGAAWAGAGVFIGAVVTPVWSTAQEIRISPVSCAQGLHLVARQAPASEVLKQLAKVAGFRVTLEEQLDGFVTIDAVRPARELLRRVLDSQNVIISERKDPRCPGRHRPARVWVLRKGTAVSPPAASKPALTWQVTPEAQEQDDLYRRAHGMLPEAPASQPSPSP